MPAKTSSISRGEIGATGTIVTGGIISDSEYNNDLKGRKRIEIVEKMRRGDATVRVSLLAVKLPIISANWFIEAASEDEADVFIAEFVRNQLLEGMTRTWQQFLREALNYLDFGHYIFEIVYDDTVFENKELIGLKKLAPRLPSTIYKWQTKEGKDGITQMTTAKGEVSIPIEKLLILVNEMEGDNWEGQTILRAAYKHWYMKDSLYKIDAIAHERQGLGIPYVKRSGKAGKKDKDKAKELIKNLRANQKGHLEIPDGWEIGFLDSKANTNKKPDWSITHHDRQITKNVMAQFLELGAGSTGSFALSADQSDLFILSEEATADHVQDGVQKYVIERIVDLNFDVEKYPQLKHEKIGSTDVNALSVAIQRLSQTGHLTNTLKTEQHLRNVMDLPELTKEEIKDYEKQQKEGFKIRDIFKSKEDKDKDKDKASKRSVQQRFSKALVNFRYNIMDIIENVKS